MTLSETDAQALDAALVAAPFTANGWSHALAQLARAGNAWAGQLIGLDPRDGLVFQVEHGFTQEQMAWLERAGGYLGGVNPRIAAMIKSAPHDVLSEPEFITVKERERSVLYQELLAPSEADLSCIGRLNPVAGTEIAWCILRPGRGGDYSPAERDALRAAMPSLEAAIRLHMAVEQRGAELTGHAFDTFGAAAFLFDRAGRVIALSGPAVRLVREQALLRLKNGELTAMDAACDGNLQQMIHQCCREREVLRAPHRIVLRHADGAVVADIAPLPRDGVSFGAGAAAILVVPAKASQERMRDTLAAAFGLTAAEAGVAASLCLGHGIEAIAQQRRVSIQTVRSQVKSILAKTGTRTQVQLVASIARLTPM